MINRVRNSLGTLSGPQKMLAAGLAAAAIGGTAAAYEIGKFADHSIKAAASFQQANTLLTTQAGVARSQVKGVADQFLTLAPVLAQTPQALTEAFFHVSSALGKFGFTTAQQLGVLKAAAQGAAVGNANLTDTTNALVGALASGVGGVRGARDAMAALLSIAAAGNMHLQDLVSAMGTGFPGALRTFGVSLQSGGAALAYLSDTGMHAQMAATRLTMAIALMGGPSQHAAKLLHAIGLASTDIHTKFAVVTQMLEKAGLSYSQLAADMRKPDGLVVAFRDLKTHMDQAGMSAQLQSAFISRAFGGGHMGKAIMQGFVEQGRIKDAYRQINAGISGFGAHWTQTTQTAIFQARSLHAAVNSISTGIGTALLPAVQKLLSALVPLVARLATLIAHHKTLAAAVLGGAFALSVLVAGLGAAGLAMMAFEAAASPVIAIIVGVMAAIAGLIALVVEIERHWSTWGKWVAIAIAAVVPFIGLPILLARYWHQIPKMTRQIWGDVTGFLVTQWNRIIAFAELYWGDFRGWLGTLWGDIRADLFSAWNDVATFFGNLWQTIKNGVLDGWGAIRDFFTGLWDGIRDAWTASWNAISSALSTAWSAISSAANTTWSEIARFFSALWDGIRTGWNATWGGIGSALDGAWHGIGGSAATTWREIKRFFDAIWNGVSAGWAAVWGGISSTLSSAWTGIKNAASTAWSAISSAAGSVWDGLSALWHKAWSDAWNIVRGFINKIIDGIDFLIRSWNSIHFGVHLPSWIPGIGGKGFDFSVPKIPLIPKLDVGGTVLSTGVATVHRGEWVVPPSMIGAAGGGGGSVVFDFTGSQIMSDADISRLADQIGSALATRGLPMAGMQVRRR